MQNDLVEANELIRQYEEKLKFVNNTIKEQSAENCHLKSEFDTLSHDYQNESKLRSDLETQNTEVPTLYSLIFDISIKNWQNCEFEFLPEWPLAGQV